MVSNELGSLKMAVVQDSMDDCKNGKVSHLVVDTSAFFKNSPIFDIGINVYTLHDVLDEIKDKATKERLQVLPREFNFREPSCESIKIVSDFAKKTGDYPWLSAVDIRVLALTYELHKEHVGIELLRTEPLPKVNISNVPNTRELSSKLPGFYVPRKKKPSSDDSTTESQEKCSDESISSSDEDDDDDDDDEEGWLDAENLEDAVKGMGMLMVEDKSVKVACITSDFSIQNILIQMGMKVVSVDGLLIRCARTFLLRCFGCLKITNQMTSKFCPHCGNTTLKRVAVTINEDGSKTVHLSFRKPINRRGTRYSLPMPKSGKHIENPIVCEDQPIPQNRPSNMSRLKMNTLNADYLPGYSPFAINDIYSRAGQLGIRGQQKHLRMNSNQGKKTSKRKK